MHITGPWDVTLVQVIPMLAGDATDQTPPDLPSFLFKERIVYLVRHSVSSYKVCIVFWCATTSSMLCPAHDGSERGAKAQGDCDVWLPNAAIKRIHTSMQGMSLVPAVTELLLAEFMYLQYDNPSRPIYLYINSTGVQVSCAKSIIKSLRQSL